MLDEDKVRREELFLPAWEPGWPLKSSDAAAEHLEFVIRQMSVMLNKKKKKGAQMKTKQKWILKLRFWLERDSGTGFIPLFSAFPDYEGSSRSCHLFQFLREDGEAFPGQPGDRISPARPGSAAGLLPVGRARNASLRKASRWPSCQMSKPPQLWLKDLDIIIRFRNHSFNVFLIQTWHFVV